jgi:hypothetical protein
MNIMASLVAYKSITVKVMRHFIDNALTSNSDWQCRYTRPFTMLRAISFCVCKGLFVRLVWLETAFEVFPNARFVLQLRVLLLVLLLWERWELLLLALQLRL